MLSSWLFVFVLSSSLLVYTRFTVSYFPIHIHPSSCFLCYHVLLFHSSFFFFCYPFLFLYYFIVVLSSFFCLRSALLIIISSFLALLSYLHILLFFLLYLSSLFVIISSQSSLFNPSYLYVLVYLEFVVRPSLFFIVYSVVFILSTFGTFGVLLSPV